MSGRLFIQASNIHQGGGRTLLGALLEVAGISSEVVVLLDERMPLPEILPDGCHVRRVRPTLFGRLGVERWLAANVRTGDTVLCMGNLPPVFRLRVRTLVFVQNRYLAESVPLASFPLRVRVRITIERLWLFMRSSNADEFIVQTPAMKRLLEEKMGVPVQMLAFAPEPERYSRGVTKPCGGQEIDFVYVATGEPHKNHRRLLEAWRLLAMEGHFPSLLLTLSEGRFPVLCAEIAGLNGKYGLKIWNRGELSPAEAKALYGEAGAVIYPSIFESFGLPLIEARQAGLSLIASERDYVRDLVDPEQTFDPESAVSIARAVKRFMGKVEPSLTVLDAKGFLSKVIDGAD